MADDALHLRLLLGLDLNLVASESAFGKAMAACKTLKIAYEDILFKSLGELDCIEDDKGRRLCLRRPTQRLGTTAALHKEAMLWPLPAAAQPMKLAKSWLPISAGLPGKLPAAGG